MNRTVYVYATEALLESGLRSQLGEDPSLTFEDCPGKAEVAVVAWPEIEERLLAKVEGLRDLGCAAVVLVLNDFDDELLPTLLELGVRGVVRAAHATPGRLVDATNAAAAGGVTLPPDLVGSLTRSFLSAPARGRTCSSARLASREEDVLRLLAEGYDTHEIAEELHYSERTIKGVVQAVIRRFGLRNRPHAVAFALRQGLI